MADTFLESIGVAELIPQEYQRGYNAGYSNGYSNGYRAGQSAASGTITQYSLSTSGWSSRSYTATGNAEVDNQQLWYQELSIRSSATALIVCGMTNMDWALQYNFSNLSISTASQGIYGIDSSSVSVHRWPSIWSSIGLSVPTTITDRNFHPKMSKGDVIMITLGVNKNDVPYLRGTGWLVLEFSSSARLRCFLTDYPNVGDSGSAFKTYLSYMRFFAV